MTRYDMGRLGFLGAHGVVEVDETTVRVHADELSA